MLGTFRRIDNKSCQYYRTHMLDILVIDDPATATVALEPIRSRLLSELAEPASAATLATRVGLARQKVTYHLNALEAHGLVRLVTGSELRHLPPASPNVCQNPLHDARDRSPRASRARQAR